MNAPRRLAAPIALVAALGFAGCSPSGSPSGGAEPAAARPNVNLVPKTEGSTAALLAHLRSLDDAYHQADSSDVDTSRANLLAYSRAVEATGKALLARKDAPEESRGKGALAIIKALRDRIELDPKAFDALIAATDRIEAENPKSRIGTLAAISRYEQIDVAPDEIVGSPAARLDRIVDALKKLARCDPPYPKTPEEIRKVMERARGLGRYDLVESLNRLALEQFPDDPYSTFASGAAHLASLHGKVFEDFKGTDVLSGRPIDIKALRGKVVIIDFWTSWCGPCMKELPDLMQFYQRLGPLGIEIIGFNLDEFPEIPRAVAQASGMRWPQLYERNVKDGGLNSPTVMRYGVAQIPLKLLIDPEGKLVATGHSMEDLGPALIPLLNRLIPAQKPPVPSAGLTPGAPKADEAASKAVVAEPKPEASEAPKAEPAEPKKETP